MKYVIVLLLTLISYSGFADEKSDKLLSNLSSKLKVLNSYKAVFNVFVDEEDIGVGEYSVNGDKFYIEILDKEIYSDGKVQYDVNNEDSEIIVDNVGANSGDVLSNPANAFNELSTHYTHKFSQKIDLKGLKYDLIKLVAKDADAGVKYVDLYLSVISGLPYKIVYKINDTESVVEVILNKIVKIESSLDLDKYKFKRSDYKDYEYIDFR